ncbi:hypothetical protein U9M48_027687 [Paspalum notatum var. saurae]|uniref:Uncharacterized protein n=1 Tax=Paspalum notatum var. saurae TaxID=547442 RepID=A0AAQ3TZY1_PASNO
MSVTHFSHSSHSYQHLSWYRWRFRTRIGGYEIMMTRETTRELETDQLYSRSPFRHFPASNSIDTQICCCFNYDHACFDNPKIGSLLPFSHIP